MQYTILNSLKPIFGKLSLNRKGKADFDSFVILEDKWITIASFLNKSDFAKMRLVNRKILEMVLVEEIKRTNNEIVAYKKGFEVADKEQAEEMNEMQEDKGVLGATQHFNSSQCYLFESTDMPSSHIVSAYRVLLFLLQKEENENVLRASDNLVWAQICDIFKGKTDLGSFLQAKFKEMRFSPFKVSKLDQFYGNSITRFVPSEFNNVCLDTGFILFYVKNALEFLGFFPEKKKFAKMHKKCLEVRISNRELRIKEMTKLKEKFVF